MSNKHDVTNTIQVDWRPHVQARVDYAMAFLEKDAEFAALDERIKTNIATVLAQEIVLAGAGDDEQ